MFPLVQRGCNQHWIPKKIFTILNSAFRNFSRAAGPPRRMAGMVFGRSRGGVAAGS